MPPRNTGRFERATVAGEMVTAFLPAALPPADPPLSLDTTLRDRLQTAERALERLEIAGEMAPSRLVPLRLRAQGGRPLVTDRSKRRDRQWAYRRYVDRLRDGTEL